MLKKILLCTLLLISLAGIGQIKISELPTHSGAPGTAWVPIVVGGVNKKVAANNFLLPAVKYSDTSAMLNAYRRSPGFGLLLSGELFKIDTSLLSTRNNSTKQRDSVVGLFTGENLSLITSRGAFTPNVSGYTQNSIRSYTDRSWIDRGYLKRFGDSLRWKERINDSLRLLFAGTSFTSGYDPATGLSMAMPFPAVVDSVLKAAGYKVVIINHGNPGDRTREGISRWAGDTALRFDYAFLEYGFNDAVNYGGLGTRNIMTYTDAMDTLIDRCLYKKASVTLMGQTPSYSGSANNKTHWLFKQALMAKNKERNLNFFDMSVITKKIGDNYINYTSDGLHLTQAAHRALGIYLANWIMRNTIATQHASINSTVLNPDGIHQYDYPVNIGFGLKYNEGDGTTEANNSVDKDSILSLIKPFGLNTQVQYNNSGSFGSSSDFTWDNSNGRLRLGTSTASAFIGKSSSSSYSGIWFGNITPSLSNYAFLGNQTETNINCPSGNVALNVGNVPKVITTATGTSITDSTAGALASSAVLDLSSTTRGFLPPRMTAAQALAISSPAEGLLVYVTDTNGTFTSKGWWGWNGTAWTQL